MQEKKAVIKTSNSVAFHIFAVMLFATFISCHVISGTLAKYVAAGTAGLDSARVASFSVSAAGNNGGELSLKYGGSADYILAVTNGSEVSVKYEVIISFTGDVHDKLAVALNRQASSGATLKTGVYDSTGNKTVFTFTDSAYQLNAGGSESYTISITGLSGFLPGADFDSHTKETSFGFSTKVLFEQID